jgi:cytoskeletal protein CcmA (bactofilin family)
MRVDAYALFFSVVLSALVFIIVNLAITNSLIYKKEIIAYRQLIQQIHNSISGVHYEMAHPTDGISNVDLFQDQENSTMVLEKPWGFFRVIISESLFRSNRGIRKVALIGSEFDDSQCLILSNSNKALALCGKTRIEGGAILPQLGVKRAYIEGQSFQGEELISGSISSSKVPVIPEKYEIHFNEMGLDRFDLRDSMVSYSGNEDTIINPFSEPTIILNCESEMTQLHGYFKGNVKIYSNHKILIDGQVKLSDVLVIASDIEIVGTNLGSCQLFARNKLVCQNSNLSYPSVLATSHLTESSNEFAIQLEASSIDGGVFYHSQKPNSRISGVQIDKESKVRGQVVSNSWVSLSGHILGQVITNNFFLKTPSSVYENHLLNAVISMKSFPQSYPLRFSGKQNKIMKWLD